LFKRAGDSPDAASDALRAPGLTTSLIARTALEQLFSSAIR
jgi:hypothetical protein